MLRSRLERDGCAVRPIVTVPCPGGMKHAEQAGQDGRVRGRGALEVAVEA